MGCPKLMIGLRVNRTARQITLDQSHYIRDVVNKFKQTKAAPVNSPATTSGCFAQASEGDSAPLDTTTYPYMSLLGSLLWLTLTRPDIATVVSIACSYGSAPTMAHWRAALRILKYLNTTSHLGLTYRLGNRLTTVSAYVDAGFANGIGRRSRYGYAVFLSGCLISWVSKCTTMVCLSTAEAEFIAATEATKDVMWIRGLLQELSLDSKLPSTVYEDNQACVSMINNSAVSPRNRHFAVKMAWLRA